MGRPKKENGKTRGIRVRMSEGDFQLLGIMAKECNTTKSRILMEGFYGLLRRFGNEDLAAFNEKLQELMKKKEENGNG